MSSSYTQNAELTQSFPLSSLYLYGACVEVRTRAGSGDGVPQHEPGGGGEEGLQPQRQGALRAGDRHREDGAGEADVP